MLANFGAPRRRRRRKSKTRGGAGAPAVCKRNLSTCMTETIREGGSMRTAGKRCMKAFARCRKTARRR